MNWKDLIADHVEDEDEEYTLPSLPIKIKDIVKRSRNPQSKVSNGSETLGKLWGASNKKRSPRHGFTMGDRKDDDDADCYNDDADADDKKCSEGLFSIRTKLPVKRRTITQESKGFNGRKMAGKPKVASERKRSLKRKSVTSEFDDEEDEEYRVGSPLPEKKKRVRESEGLIGSRISKKPQGTSSKQSGRDHEYIGDKYEDANDEEYEKEDNTMGKSLVRARTSVRKRKIPRDNDGCNRKKPSQKRCCSLSKTRKQNDDYSASDWETNEGENEGKQNGGPSSKRAKASSVEKLESSHGKRITESRRSAMNKNTGFGGDFYYGLWIHDQENDSLEEETKNRSRDSDGLKTGRSSRDTKVKNYEYGSILYGHLSSSSSSSVTVIKHDQRSKRCTTSNHKDDGKECLKCHQCRRHDRRIVVPCTKCKQRIYCIQCIKQWYLHMSEEEIAENCPVCRRNCNCNLCLHSNSMINASKRDPTDQKKG